jgi:hypothetical protein
LVLRKGLVPAVSYFIEACHPDRNRRLAVKWRDLHVMGSGKKEETPAFAMVPALGVTGALFSKRAAHQGRRLAKGFEPRRPRKPKSIIQKPLTRDWYN